LGDALGLRRWSGTSGVTFSGAAFAASPTAAPTPTTLSAGVLPATPLPATTLPADTPSPGTPFRAAHGPNSGRAARSRGALPMIRDWRNAVERRANLS
jgi:hypothetical protein